MCQNCSESKLVPIFLHRSQSQRPHHYITSNHQHHHQTLFCSVLHRGQATKCIYEVSLEKNSSSLLKRNAFIYSLITTNSQQGNLASVSLDLQMHFSEIISQEKVSTEVGGYTPENLQLHPQTTCMFYFSFFVPYH